jgi:hypothetical protein
MPAWMTGREFLGGLIASLAARFTVKFEDTSEPPRYLRDWLARLRLLYGVPFEYLVPDARLLPKESIRFFFIDRNWTDRLVDGALSVGKTTTLEYARHQAAHAAIAASVDAEEAAVRPRLRDVQASAGASAPLADGDGTATGATGGTAGTGTTAPPPAPDITGLLMRSAIVRGWPGLEVRASRNNVPLALLRMERLAPDLLICLFSDVPTRVEIAQPPEGVQFGVDVVPAGAGVPSGFQISLRRMHPFQGLVAGGGTPPAVGALTGKTIPVAVRSANRRVLHVTKLKQDIELALGQAPKVPFDPTAASEGRAASLSSAEFAIQLLQGSYRQAFTSAGTTPRRGRTPESARGRRRTTGGRAGDGGQVSNGETITVPLSELTVPFTEAELSTFTDVRRRRPGRKKQ